MSQRSGAEHMFANMVEFLQAPSWDGSARVLLRQPELMSDAGYPMLGFMISDPETVSWIYPGVDPALSDILIQLHYVLLGRSRQIGIGQALAELQDQIRAAAGPGPSDKVPLSLGDFLTATDGHEAIDVLRRSPQLADARIASLLDRLVASARERGDLARLRRLAERRRLLDQPGAGGLRNVDRRDDPRMVAVVALVGVAVVVAALAVVLTRGNGSDPGVSFGPPADTPPSTGAVRTPSKEPQPSATGTTKETAGTTPRPSGTPAVAGTHAPPPRPTAVEPTAQASDTASPTIPPDPSPPQIDGVETYQEGALVYFRLLFSDPDGDAEGFGFRGANGSAWPEESHPFSSPSLGRVGPGRIDYPFNQGCGTYQEYESDVEAWIYDSEGMQSESVVIHLACDA